jgi:hypothetical protein
MPTTRKNRRKNGLNNMSLNLLLSEDPVLGPGLDGDDHGRHSLGISQNELLAILEYLFGREAQDDGLSILGLDAQGLAGDRHGTSNFRSGFKIQIQKLRPVKIRKLLQSKFVLQKWSEVK